MFERLGVLCVLDVFGRTIHTDYLKSNNDVYSRSRLGDAQCSPMPK